MVGAVNDEQALAILYDLALTIGSEVNVEPLMVKTLQRLLYHTGFPVGLWLTEMAGDSCRLELAIGDYHLIRRKGERLALAPELVVGEAALFDASPWLPSLQLRKPMVAALRLPVPGQGVILLLGPRLPAAGLSLPELFSPILERLARSLTLCRSYEQEVRNRVERTAYYDALTGLPNAILFNNTLSQSVVSAKAKGRWLALIHLDLDDFRRFNAQQGSDMANQVLVVLGQRLSASLHQGELLARIAGDEFMLLLPDLGGWDDVDERIVRILQTNRTPLEVNGAVVDITFSAGIAVLPVDSDDGDTLVRHAQIALHQAKQESRGYFRLFDGEQDKRTHARRELLWRLDLAMENRELHLYYQPKVDMPSGRILGFEALLRWRHPERGLIAPGEFLPLVEDSDFLVQLGEWAMREALAQAVSWRIAGLETCISVNIAGRHLQLPDFPERVRQALADVPGARPDSLEIEILESSILGDMDHVREVMQACTALGVRFALDDFGTGYSSLAYLHQLPAATIKIDQLFIRNLFQQAEDPAILKAVVGIASAFERRLVAEGVEEPEHGMLLVAMGCPIGQGYGIGRPMAAEAVLPWVGAFHPRREWALLQGVAWCSPLYQLLRLRLAHRQRHETVAAWQPPRGSWPGMAGADDLAPWLASLTDARVATVAKAADQWLGAMRQMELQWAQCPAAEQAAMVRDWLQASSSLLLALDELALLIGHSGPL